MISEGSGLRAAGRVRGRDRAGDGQRAGRGCRRAVPACAVVAKGVVVSEVG